MIRTVTAVERADVVVVVIDASEGVTEQDAKIAGIAHERGKGVIIAVNKWDAIEKDDKTIYKHTNSIREILTLYALCRDRVYFCQNRSADFQRCLRHIDAVIENQHYAYRRLVCLMRSLQKQLPCSSRRLTGARRLKIFYMTQVAVKPPTFVIFVNDKELMHFSYTRYLENKIRDAFDFGGTTAEIYCKRARREGIKVWNVLFVWLLDICLECFRRHTLSEKSITWISVNMEAAMQELPMPFVLLEKKRGQ